MGKNERKPQIQIMVKSGLAEDNEGRENWSYVYSDGADEPALFSTTEAAKSWLKVNGKPIVEYLIIQTKARVRLMQHTINKLEPVE